MKLVYYPLSPFSQKVLIGMYEKSAAFVPEIIPEFDPKLHEEYRKLHPLAKVPMLIDDTGRPVLESSIIIEYVDSRFDTGPRLIPQDRDAALLVRFLDRVFDSDLTGPLSALFFAKMRDEGGTKEVLAAREKLDRMYRFLDDQVSERVWAAGEAFTLADCAAAPALSNADRSYPFDSYPHIVAYAKRLAERASILRVRQEAGPFAAKMRGAR